MLRHPPSSRCPPFAHRTSAERVVERCRRMPRRPRSSTGGSCSTTSGSVRDPALRESASDRRGRQPLGGRERPGNAVSRRARRADVARARRSARGACSTARMPVALRHPERLALRLAHGADEAVADVGRARVPRTSTRAGGIRAPSAWPTRQSEATGPDGAGTRKGPGRSRGPSWRHVLLDAPS